jgi:hypothetical protein
LTFICATRRFLPVAQDPLFGPAVLQWPLAGFEITNCDLEVVLPFEGKGFRIDARELTTRAKER